MKAKTNEIDHQKPGISGNNYSPSGKLPHNLGMENAPHQNRCQPERICTQIKQESAKKATFLAQFSSGEIASFTMAYPSAGYCELGNC
jgi:hypothetical protein